MAQARENPPAQDRVAEQMALAREPWSAVGKALAGQTDLLAILDDLYSQALPYLIKGYAACPIHHVAYVVSFMAQITAADDKLGPADIKRGVLAALLHDIGLSEAVLPKITEEMVHRAPPSERDRLRREGIAARREHMEKGRQIARDLLSRYRAEHPLRSDLRSAYREAHTANAICEREALRSKRFAESVHGQRSQQAFAEGGLSADDIEVITEIVGTHDNSKIPLLEPRPGKEWLLAPGDEDWLKQCHWEADALWMLCPAGILIDLQREKKPDTPQTRKQQFDFNLGLHREIVNVYRQAYSAAEMERFAFRDGLLYRTRTGYALAMAFKLQAEAW